MTWRVDMRREDGGVGHIAKVIQEDLAGRQTGLQKPHIAGLADLAASVLTCRSVNTAEWQAVLPRQDCDDKSKERYISRFLANRLICPIQVMGGFLPQILEQLSRNDQTIVLMLDQSKVGDGFECLMLSIRIGERAIPVAWRVIETEGAIGFKIQKSLLDSVLFMISENASILLAADRFYGTSALIGWCQKHRWSYRIRLKGNLILLHEGGEITTGEAASLGLTALLDAQLGESVTHIGIIHEAGHPEPWIIAMDAVPTPGRILDYGMRWGIEPMFSDFKSRGFGITQTHLQHAERIERLILVLTIAIYWAVSSGMQPSKKAPRQTNKKAQRSLTSFFKRGLRILLNTAIILAPIPHLWHYLHYVGC